MELFATIVEDLKLLSSRAASYVLQNFLIRHWDDLISILSRVNLNFLKEKRDYIKQCYLKKKRPDQAPGEMHPGGSYGQ